MTGSDPAPENAPARPATGRGHAKSAWRAEDLTPHQGSYAIHLRRITANVIIAITLLMAAAACTPAQVTAFFAHQGQTIDQADASYVAQALTVWADQQRALLAYLAAVDAQIPNEARWDRVAQCESGGNWHANTGNGYYGGLQFLPSTWRAVGGTGLPHQHSKAEQIRRAEILKARAGLGQWPVCGRLW